MKKLHAIAAAVLAMAAGGCVSSCPTYSYLLCPDEASEVRFGGSVLVGGVRLAGYLERQSLVRRNGRHSVDFCPDIQWAQDFGGMVKETLESNLLMRCGGRPEDGKYMLLVDFMSFEEDTATGRFNVSVLCTMRSGAEVRKRHFVYGYDCRGVSGEKLVGLYDRALSELSDRICDMANEEH